MLGRTLNTQLYIDSQQTIMNDLKDTFSCKNSNQSTNILKINTSTYSVTRTANHISQRLSEASKRLETIERSVSKSRNKAKNQGFKNNESIKSQQMMEQSQRTLKSQKQLELSNIYVKSQRSYIQLINKLKDEVAFKNNLIEELENKLGKKQKLILSQQQKYLKQQNALIIEINRLKDLLQQISENQNRTFREKIEMERVVDEHKVRLWQLETKLKNSYEIGKGWEKKQKLLKLLTKKYYSDIEKQQVSMKRLSKKGKNNKQLINSFVNVLGLEEELYDEDKENKCEFSNRNKNSQCNQLEEWQGQTYRSFTVQKGKKDSGLSLMRAQRILQKEFLDEGVKTQNEDLYYFLAVQASTIQKLGI